MNIETSQDYTGVDNLETMALAVNYNNSIFQLLEQSYGLARKSLDFGAGTGLFSMYLRDRHKDVEAIEADRQLQANLKANGFVVHQDLKNVEPGRFDFIYSINVLEHIEDDKAILRDFRRQLASDGRLFLYLPAFNILWTTMDTKVGHFRRYTLSEIRAKLREAGFKIDKIGYCDTVGFFASLAFKVIGSKNGSINPRSLIFFDRFLFPLNAMLDRIFKYVLGKNVYVIASPNK